MTSLMPDKLGPVANMLCHSEQTQKKHYTFTVEEAEVSIKCCLYLKYILVYLFLQHDICIGNVHVFLLYLID